MSNPLSHRLCESYAAVFGETPAIEVRAPGRVNLIGEHTDYNDGFVLPCAIDHETRVAASPLPGRRLEVVAADFGDARDTIDLDAPPVPHPDAPWANYVRGVVALLQASGHRLGGARLAIAGNVPLGAGLSSSAALEVAVAHALQRLNGLDIDRSALARLAQRAENEFVGCQCGIMDQLISARGRAGHALLIDCRSLQVRPVALPQGVAVVIMHSRVARGLVDSAYNERRQQCVAAARHAGVPALRDLDLATLRARAAGLDERVLRRARHVVTENQRTLDAAEALARGDLVSMGRLMAESHASMRDDFEITVPAIDRLVATAQAAIGEQGGVRMTGGGFGGCVVALLPQERVPALQAAVARDYRSPAGEPATLWTCRARDGVGIA